MDAEITKAYGNRLRLRICGLCWQDHKLLMVNHQGLTGGDFWAPPGGGMSFGEGVEDCLRREFVEETGLQVTDSRFAFVCERLKPPLHAVELFFNVTATGDLQTGDDPELSIIRAVRFMDAAEIAAVPSAFRHGIFDRVRSAEDLKTLSGFFAV